MMILVTGGSGSGKSAFAEDLSLIHILLSVLVPADKTEYLYAFLIFLRIYLAGIAFSRYCFYHKNSNQATLLGSLVYIFAGWTIYASMKHPYFANPMIYLPLILLGIDKIYRKEKPYVFIWSVALAGVSNFYFFYMPVSYTHLDVYKRQGSS